MDIYKENIIHIKLNEADAEKLLKAMLSTAYEKRYEYNTFIYGLKKVLGYPSE